ncbi:hypothetical protein F8G81_23410 [Arthrobacter sp. CDRTa11]|nr:hypothetical protein F8G81_23410 [Arthrobacter sp. CDRTa11]
MASSQDATTQQPLQSSGRQAEAHGSGAAGSGDAQGPGKPKVSLWSEEDYGYDNGDQDGLHDAAADSGQRRQPGESPQADRSAKKFPAFSRSAAGVSPASVPPSTPARDYDAEEPEREPRSMRWLVGGLLALVLIAGLVFAVTNLGSLFTTTPQATSTDGTTPAPSDSASAAPTQSSAPPTAPPAIEGITRQGDFDFAATYDVDLVKAYDGNAASYWSDMEFATENWGGLSPNGVPLFIKLKAKATVSSVTLTQLGASGGNVSVYTNDRPSLDGAKLVGTNSFTSTDLTMPLAQPVEAQYVIMSIKSLPKLAAPKTRYGYGIRLAEVKIQ